MTIINGSSVAVNGKAILIKGDSGSGKSTLALDMISRGAKLIADDKVQVERQPCGTIVLSAPPQIAGMVEARGVGLLRIQYCNSVPLVAIIDLDVSETERLPERKINFLGSNFPLIYGCSKHSLAASMIVMLQGELLQSG